MFIEVRIIIGYGSLKVVGINKVYGNLFGEEEVKVIK